MQQTVNDKNLSGEILNFLFFNFFVIYNYGQIMNLVATIAFFYPRNVNNYTFNFTIYLFV